jgi:hypothetical protein
VGYLEREERLDLQQQIFIAIRSAAENQKQEQELAHGRSETPSGDF